MAKFVEQEKFGFFKERDDIKTASDRTPLLASGRSREKEGTIK